ncbi:hypothetical protein G7Z17_g12276 [Cylindrodendrum hubeiense]|uniref:chitinase n=1 Tax=Cylindrodendrum hubeiense TaxID=595255 RepID=A0A9P5L9F5_9HYPO|nr:hypothetical protein G7Z17_g12276 [Cylindrodendrum hubeiense]
MPDYTPGVYGGGLNGYWGQYGYDSMKSYCDSGVEYVTLAFVNSAPENEESGWPGTNFAGHCPGSVFQYEEDGVLYDSNLWSNCYLIQEGIPYCQSLGVKVLLSIGGDYNADTSNYKVATEESGRAFAHSLYQIFGPLQAGYDGPRPFDSDAYGVQSVDGFDFDIEQDFDMTPYIAMIDELRSYDPSLLITAAPQCPTSSDWFYMEELIQTSQLDALFVQFYNNPDCDLLGDGEYAYDNFNYLDWENVLTSSTASKSAKIYVGLPASDLAAGTGYITPTVISEVIQYLKDRASFGGISLWDLNRGASNIVDLEGTSFNDAVLEALGVTRTTSAVTSSAPTSTSEASTTTAVSTEASTTASISTEAETTAETTTSISTEAESTASVSIEAETTTSTDLSTSDSTSYTTDSTADSTTGFDSTPTTTPGSDSVPTTTPGSDSAPTTTPGPDNAPTGTPTDTQECDSSTEFDSTSTAPNNTPTGPETTPGVETPSTTAPGPDSTSTDAANESTSAGPDSTPAGPDSTPTGSDSTSTSTAIVSTPVGPDSTPTGAATTSGVETSTTALCYGTECGSSTTAPGPDNTPAGPDSTPTGSDSTSTGAAIDGTSTGSDNTFTSSDSAPTGAATDSIATGSATDSTAPGSEATGTDSTATGPEATGPEATGSATDSLPGSEATGADSTAAGALTTTSIPYGGAATTESASSTTSTVYTTHVYTVTKCPPEVTNCPANAATPYVTTEIVALYTTVCPVTAAEKSTTKAGEASKPEPTYAAVSEEVKTVYTTNVHTVTMCPAYVTDCPVGSITTEVSSYTTTVVHVAGITAAEVEEEVPEVSTLYTTKIHTITKCPAYVTDCPVGSVTTEVSSWTTTVAKTTETASVEVPEESVPEETTTVKATSTIYTTVVVPAATLETSSTSSAATSTIYTTIVVPAVTLETSSKPSATTYKSEAETTDKRPEGVAATTGGCVGAGCSATTHTSPSATIQPVTAGASTAGLGLTAVIAAAALQMLVL